RMIKTTEVKKKDQNMEESKLQIIRKEDGCESLVVGSKEYIISNRDDVELDGQEIPNVRIGQIPGDLQFTLLYRDLIICVPDRYTSKVSVCIVQTHDRWNN